jgi:hypothetical protein
MTACREAEHDTIVINKQGAYMNDSIAHPSRMTELTERDYNIMESGCSEQVYDKYAPVIKEYGMTYDAAHNVMTSLIVNDNADDDSILFLSWLTDRAGAPKDEYSAVLSVRIHDYMSGYHTERDHDRLINNTMTLRTLRRRLAWRSLVPWHQRDQYLELLNQAERIIRINDGLLMVDPEHRDELEYANRIESEYLHERELTNKIIRRIP